MNPTKTLTVLSSAKQLAATHPGPSRHLLALGVGLMLSACAVGPDYVRPT